MVFTENMGTFDGTSYHIPFESVTKFGVFRDTLHFTVEEFEAVTDESLASMKLARVTNWVSFVQDMSTRENPNPEPEPTEPVSEPVINNG